jgi:hypothetical protein
MTRRASGRRATRQADRPSVMLEGFTVTETAKRLGIPLESVRLRIDYFANEISDPAQPDVEL